MRYDLIDAMMDAADPAVSQQIAEHFHTYNTHAIHQGRSPGRWPRE